MKNLQGEILRLCGGEAIDRVLLAGREVPVDWFLSQAKRIDYSCEEEVQPRLKVLLEDGSWIQIENDFSCRLERIHPPAITGAFSEKELDVSLLLANEIVCPLFPTSIDGHRIDREPSDESYSTWSLAADGVTFSEHEYLDGGLKPDHQGYLDCFQ